MNETEGNRTNTILRGMTTRTAFGGTLTFTANVKVDLLLNCLSMRNLPAELVKVYKDVQRVATPKRISGMETYIGNHLDDVYDVAGYMPPITVSLRSVIMHERNPNRLDSLQFDPAESFAVDGLGRLETLMGMIGGYVSPIKSRSKEATASRQALREKVRELVRDLELTVCFIISATDKPLEHRDLGQIFGDINFNQASVNPSKAMKLNVSDPVIEWAREIGKLPEIQNVGGMTDSKSRITVTTKQAITLNTAVKYCQGALGGKALQAKTTGAQQLQDGTDVNKAYVTKEKKAHNLFLTTWVESQGSRFEQDKSAYQVNSSVIQALGLVSNLIVKVHSGLPIHMLEKELKVAAQKLADLDYSRFAEHWAASGVMELRDKGYANSAGGGRTFREGLASYFMGVTGYKPIK